ncbi:hypothetical protein CVT26_007433 [Gymnopilus dilepis]|uniref:HMG box domain-containing protein n=1 Tax=Gymnopilus dilepis TaxID=231916 RepID=A0A409WIR9_9AGAR|nr:hypothetical protein CVT26_007433 [Gymnopilus dilepis]
MPALRHGYGYVYTDKLDRSGFTAGQSDRTALSTEQSDYDAAISSSLVPSGTNAAGFPAVASSTSTSPPRQSGCRYSSRHPYANSRPFSAITGAGVGRLVSQDGGRGYLERPDRDISAIASDAAFYTNPIDHHTPRAVAPLIASLPSSSHGHRRRYRRDDPEYVPRPRNAFMCYRSVYAGAHPDLRQQELSREAGIAWHAMLEGEKHVYEDRAENEDQLHKALFPEYPRRKTTSKRKKKLCSCSSLDAQSSVLACMPLPVSPDSPVALRVAAFRAAQKAADACSLPSPSSSPGFSGSEYMGSPPETASPFVDTSAALSSDDEEQTLVPTLYNISSAATPVQPDDVDCGTGLNEFNNPFEAAADENQHGLNAAADVTLSFSSSPHWLRPQNDFTGNVDLGTYDPFAGVSAPPLFASTSTASSAAAASSSSSSMTNQFNDPELDPINNWLSELDLSYHESGFNYHNFGSNFVVLNDMNFDLTDTETLGELNVEGFDYSPYFGGEEIESQRGKQAAA